MTENRELQLMNSVTVEPRFLCAFNVDIVRGNTIARAVSAAALAKGEILI